MSVTRKRKHIALTIAQKLEILRKMEKGEKTEDLSKEYGIGLSTIYDMKKKSDQLKSFEDMYKHNESIKNTRKSTRFGRFPELEDKLYNWFIEEQKKEIYITGDIIKEKATLLSKEMNIQDKFKATGGWLTKFKQRFEIRLTVQKLPEVASKVKSCEDKESEDKEYTCEDEIYTYEGKELSDEDISVTNDSTGNIESDKNTLDVSTHNGNCSEAAKGLDVRRNEMMRNLQSFASREGVKPFEEEKQEIIHSISHSEVVQAFDTCIKWAEQNNAAVSDIFTLKRLGEKALTLSFESEIKKTFDNFFPGMS